MTNMLLEPTIRRGRTLTFVFVALFLASSLAVVVRELYVNGLLLSAILRSFGIVVISVVLALWVIYEFRRGSEIKLDDAGIAFLKWRVLPYPRLQSDHLKWTEIEDVGFRSGVVFVRAQGLQVTVNTTLFDDPARVIALITDAARRNKGRPSQ